MNSHLVARIIIDALFKAEIIDDEEAYKKAIAYVDSIPGNLKATIEDYEKWRSEDMQQ